MTDFKQGFPKHKPLGCSAHWHLKHSRLYLAIYGLIGKITSNGENEFFASIHHVSQYFDFNYEATRRVFGGLRKAGWIEKAVMPGHFIYVTHETWAAANPGKCNERELLPWQEETDPLIGKLWAASNGKLRAFDNMARQARAVADSDEQIVEAFKFELGLAKANRAAGNYANTSPNNCLWKAVKRLRALRAAVENTVSE